MTCGDETTDRIGIRTRSTKTLRFCTLFVKLCAETSVATVKVPSILYHYKGEIRYITCVIPQVVFHQTIVPLFDFRFFIRTFRRLYGIPLFLCCTGFQVFFFSVGGVFLILFSKSVDTIKTLVLPKS